MAIKKHKPTSPGRRFATWLQHEAVTKTEPERSLASSTEVQKQVGHTMVQLPQVRQRVATSSQRGCSRLSMSSG